LSWAAITISMKGMEKSVHSDVCWKGKHSIVHKMLGRLKSESAKLEALKENIRMQVVGLGWKQFAIT
jgi:hypothetical protein